MSRRHRANPRWNGPIFRHERRGARYEAPGAAQCEPQGVNEGAGAALEAARRPDAEQLPHEQPEIQAADLQEQALEDVAVSAQVHAAHPSGCVEMRMGTFEAFTAPTLAMIKRRAAAADLPPSTCCHTFRATWITAYLSNGGTLEHAQQIVGHASPKTTKLHVRTAGTISVDEIERIVSSTAGDPTSENRP